MNNIFNHSEKLFSLHLFNNLVYYYYDNINIIYKEYKSKKRQSSNNDILPSIYDNFINIFEKHMSEIIYHNKAMIIESNINGANKKYVIMLCNNKMINKLYSLYMYLYYFNTELYNEKQRKMLYVCIDFEFYKNDIALMQVNYETNNKYSYIWLNNPRDFAQEQLDIFVNIILTNNKIYKILHGSESNDIPYLYSKILVEKKNIINFTRRLIDTRYLCEYAKYKSEHKKCSLYDALLFFSVIDNKQYDYLNNINKRMGPIQYIKWNINNMKDTQICYALYDVLYLKLLVDNTYKYVTLKYPELLKTYKYTLAITRFVFLERIGNSNIVEKIKNTIDNYNTYLIKINNKQFSITDIYTILCDKIYDKLNINIEHIYNVGYIKKYFSYLIKCAIYSALCEKHIIYLNKKEKLELCFNIKSVIKQLELYRCKKIIDLLEYIKEYIYFLDNLL